jgi:hypothetical protein
MKIKILWGFVGNGLLLGGDSNKVKAGTAFEEADDEYAHTLIGKGLAVEVDGNGKSKLTKPKGTKPGTPAENKDAGPAPENKDGNGTVDAATPATTGAGDD